MASEEELYKMICNYYDNKGISYQHDDKNYLILVINKDREVPVNLFVSVEKNPLTLRICGQLPFRVPKESKDMMIMALQAINQRLSVGHFQMNINERKIEYRMNFPLVGIRFDEEWLENVINDAFFTITQRDEKILSLLRKEITFEDFDKYVR